MEGTLKQRCVLFASWFALSSIFFARPLFELFRVSISSDDASYIIVIPFISTYVLVVERRSIFSHLSCDKVLAGILLLGAACVLLLTTLTGSSASVGPRLSAYILGLVMLWVAGFTFLFGRPASTVASFPLLFLLMMVPFPQPLLDRVIYLLQVGSTSIAGTLFDLCGVPALREGFVFHLVSVNIEVAKECSGIRSSIILLIVSLLIAHFQLKRFWNKTLLVMCGVLMMILKNGIRIVTLTLLAMYVDPSFLTGRLHHQGGVVFFLLGLLLLMPVLRLLKRGESWWPARRAPQLSQEPSL